MITSAAAFKTFGIPMQRRSTRRKLVVLTYVVLALICAGASFAAASDSASFSFAVWAALLVGMFIFGGQGRFGLIKPFLNKPPRPESPGVDLVRLHLDPPVAGASDTAAWKNDERELARRDRAHYLAYQPLALAAMFLLLLSSYALHHPGWLPLGALLSLTYVIALVATMLAITLPSAIILWTEPDIDLNA